MFVIPFLVGGRGINAVIHFFSPIQGSDLLQFDTEETVEITWPQFYFSLAEKYLKGTREINPHGNIRQAERPRRPLT